VPALHIVLVADPAGRHIAPATDTVRALVRVEVPRIDREAADLDSIAAEAGLDSTAEVVDLGYRGLAEDHRTGHLEADMANRRNLAEEVDSTLVVGSLDSSAVLGCSLVAGKASLSSRVSAKPIFGSSTVSYTYSRPGMAGLVAADSKT
jgi:hypothetical protein